MKELEFSIHKEGEYTYITDYRFHFIFKWRYKAELTPKAKTKYHLEKQDNFLTGLWNYVGQFDTAEAAEKFALR